MNLLSLLLRTVLSILLSVLSVSSSYAQLPKNESASSARYVIEDVPYIRQIGAQCGPASLAMVLNYWGVDKDQNALAQQIGTATGTSPRMMIDYPRSIGFKAENYSGSLERIAENISNCRPVIVMQWLNYGDRQEARVGHYRVVTGYDREKKLIFMNDPNRNGHSRLDFSVFLDLWDTRMHPHGTMNWMLVIYRP
jgi:ABC-type bacteriocin/lantibiotic exporter with double-glycine peptidase domain